METGKKKNSRKTPGIQNTRDVLHKKNSCELTGYLLKCFKYKGKKLDLFLKIFCLCLYRSVKLEMIFFFNLKKSYSILKKTLNLMFLAKQPIHS